MEIDVINKEIFSTMKTYNIELELNEKTVEISVVESDDHNTGHIAVDWEILDSSEELDENEIDFIDDWVKYYKYEDK